MISVPDFKRCKINSDHKAQKNDPNGRDFISYRFLNEQFIFQVLDSNWGVIKSPRMNLILTRCGQTEQNLNITEKEQIVRNSEVIIYEVNDVASKLLAPDWYTLMVQ